MANAYWGRIPDNESFPHKSGTNIKIVTLGRVGLDNDHGWHQVNDSLCETNLCAPTDPAIIHNGFDEKYYSLIRREIRTDWICINAMAFREIAVDELNHFQAGINEAVRYAWDECYRSRTIHMSDNKIVSLVPESAMTGDVTCDTYSKSCSLDSRNNGFIFEHRIEEDGSVGEIDERFLRVNVHPDQIPRISEFTLDMADDAVLSLQYDEGNFIAGESGIDLHDLVLAHQRMGTRLAEMEDQQMNNAMSYGGFDAAMLKRKLGTKRVFRDMYSARYDIHSMRFFPDTAFNAGLAAYNPNDPTTWPRFRRAFAYIPAMAGTAGIKYVENQAYKVAPFGISVILSPLVIKGQKFPDISGIGGATKKDPGGNLGYAGNVTWFNPDWPQNENREMGFWKARLGVAIKPQYTEYGYCWFHRIDHRIATQFNPCPIQPAPCEQDVSPYCGLNTGGDTDWGDFAPQSNGGNLLVGGSAYV
jgi:hypothetical protein